MISTPEDLKSAASAEKAEVQSRVRGAQGGVSTYFDLLLFKILNHLEASESLHGWDVRPHVLSRDNQATAGRFRRALSLVPRLLGRQVARAGGGSARPPANVLAELHWLATYLESRGEGRFVSYDVRLNGAGAKRASDIRSPERAMSQGTAGCLTWKGSPLFKSVFDFAILPMLMWELKPASVFEIGSGTGASARWIADILDGFGLSSQVYSTDIKPVRETHPRVQFLAGDSKSPTTLFGAELLRSAPRPYLVIEDAHVNVREVFRYIDEFLMTGDYFFIEDSLTKAGDLEAFLRERPNRYAVDTRYTDFFGRNATSAINSILARV